MAELLISAQGWTVGLLPEVGGCLTRLDWSPAPGAYSVPLLRPSEAEAMTAGDPGGLACFPMLPFVNRIADGRFTWHGRRYQLPLNRLPEPHAIHGFGFQAVWAVAERRPDFIRLIHEHANRVSPFRYQADLTIQVRPDVVIIVLAVTHLGTEPCPYGLGLHPYFPRDKGTRLALAADRWFPTDARKLPLSAQPIGPGQAFHTSKPVSQAAPLDATFSGWNGKARIDWPERGASLNLVADGAFRAAHLFLPNDRPAFCVEPVSQLPNQVNRPEFDADLPPIILEIGQRAIGRLCLFPSAENSSAL
jgi:aldose 1-epimerase